MTNPFPVPSPLTKVLIREITQVAKDCYERGWSYGTAGNFSVREGDCIWQSPSGWCKGQLKVNEFISVNLETGIPVSPMSALPSLEMPVHLAIYKKFEDARVVVHTHPPELVKLSSGKNKITFSDREMQKALGMKSHAEALEIDVQKNLTPEEMKNYVTTHAKNIRGNVKCVVLSGHGVYAWGKTPIEALSYIEALETLCLSGE